MGDAFGLVRETLGQKFIVERELGQGRLHAYRARHLERDMPVALHCFPLGVRLSRDQRKVILERLTNELRDGAQLLRGTAEIAKCLGLGMTKSRNGDAIAYVATEWLDGRSLPAELRSSRAAPMKRARLPPDLFQWLSPAVDAIGFAHDHGLSHGDLHPRSFFLTPSAGTPKIKVMHWGALRALAKVLHEVAPLTNISGLLATTYRAPEAAVVRTVDGALKADVYALALVVLEFLADRPLVELAGGADAWRRMSTDRVKRPTPRALGLTVPTLVEDIMKRAVAIEPNARPSVTDFFAVLQGGFEFGPRDPAPIPRPTAPGSATSTAAVSGRARPSDGPISSVRPSHPAVISAAPPLPPAASRSKTGGSPKAPPLPPPRAIRPAPDSRP